MSQSLGLQFLTTTTLTTTTATTSAYGQGTHHGLAGQLEIGHRDCNLLVVMIPGHDFYHITLIFGPLGEAELGRVHRFLGFPQARTGTSGGIYPTVCPTPVVAGSLTQESHPCGS